MLQGINRITGTLAQASVQGFKPLDSGLGFGVLGNCSMHCSATYIPVGVRRIDG